jgi:hypothetical protein
MSLNMGALVESAPRIDETPEESVIPEELVGPPTITPRIDKSKFVTFMNQNEENLYEKSEIE